MPIEEVVNEDGTRDVTVTADVGLTDKELEVILAERAVASAERATRREAAQTEVCPTCGRAKAVN